MNSIIFSEERNEETCYGYCNEYQPHAVKRMFDYKNGMLYDLRWDEAGNLGQVSIAKTGEMFDAGRFLFWTEDNRMHAAVDDKHYSYYAYDYGGERRLKLVGVNSSVDVNAEYMTAVSTLNEPTLYPSAYMVLTNKGYTKHYYAGTERVAARLGGGGLNALHHVIDNDGELQTKADILFKQSLEQVNSRVLNENDLECIMRNRFAKEEFGHPIEGIPCQMKAEVKCDHGLFKEMVHSMLDDRNHGQEKEVYFYHSDHLGSASWITDSAGIAVQHLQYLPYGEPYINQHPYGYSERFTFTGKERDEETGYGYFGARYMDHELMTMWLSVDPMADKYPSISPYAYCAWNPVKLVDPDGREVTITGATGKTYYWYKGSLYTHKSHAKQYKVSDSDLNKIYNKGDNVTYNVTKNLESMYGKRQGKKVLDALSGSGMTFNISSDIPSSGDASYANKEVKLGTRHRSLLALSHELFHAYQDYKGRNGRSIYNEVEAYIFQAIIDGNTEGITSRNGDKKYNSAGKSLVTSFSESDFNYVLSNFQATSVANSSGAYRKERYEFNPLNLKAKDSLLKDL